MVLLMTERPLPPPSAAPAEGGVRELTCKRRICRKVLARVIGVTLVFNDNTRLGPVVKGQVFSRKCPRCGSYNVIHL